MNNNSNNLDLRDNKLLVRSIHPPCLPRLVRDRICILQCLAKVNLKNQCLLAVLTVQSKQPFCQRSCQGESPERLVESRFVLTEKVEETGETIVKGRWTPTISSNGRFAVLQCIASCQFRLQLGDVTAAFLEGDQIERKRGPLYLKQPEVLFEVVKPLYGFNDSPQLWFCKFGKQNWRQSVLDPCVFYWLDRLQPHGIGGVLGVHVDDVLTGKGQIL